MAGSITYTAKKGLKLLGSEVGAWLNNSKTVDLSTNAHDLVENGTVTESAVATGSTVMGYSGFSASNYLEQSYDSALDFGTGDFSVSAWVNASSSTVGTIFDRGTTGGAVSFKIDLSSGFLRVASSIVVTDVTEFELNSWNFVVATRISGIAYLYVNGVLRKSGSLADDVSSGTAISRVGLRSNGVNLLSGTTALVRVGAGLTATQIKTIYDSEKHMFKANSIFTQVGESYSIDLRLDKVDRSEKVESSTVKSLGGNQETVYQRTDVMYGINCKNVPKASLPKYRVWLQSVSAGETFTFDPYGTVASPDDPISVIADGGHRESRVDNLDYFNISQKLREV